MKWRKHFCCPSAPVFSFFPVTFPMYRTPTPGCWKAKHFYHHHYHHRLLPPWVKKFNNTRENFKSRAKWGKGGEVHFIRTQENRRTREWKQKGQGVALAKTVPDPKYKRRKTKYPLKPLWTLHRVPSPLMMRVHSNASTFTSLQTTSGSVDIPRKQDKVKRF